MVTAQRPAEFLAGDRTAGSALPHAETVVESDGTITVTGLSVFRGYWPEVSALSTFRTQDIGEMKGKRLQVHGRRDSVIISGGEKINPLEVEAVLRATEEFSDVTVVGMRDSEWGERVVACYDASAKGREPDLARVARAVTDQLTIFKRPKEYVAIADWPRNAQGKLNRRELENYLKR